MSKLHVIYIPGLGAQDPIYQRKAVNLWRRYGVEPELYLLNWADKQPWEKKFNRLLKRIDQIHKKGQKVALVGVSAGAAAVINAYAARKEKIVGVVCLSGKIHRPDNIGARYRLYNPSFITAAYASPRSLATLDKEDRKHILCRYAIFDEIVLTRDSRIDGARNRLSPTVLHSPTIFFQLVFGAPSFLRFLKRQTAK